MDIYQILTEYNNPWSSREIFCFSCIMVIAVIMMIYLLRKEKMNKLQQLRFWQNWSSLGLCLVLQYLQGRVRSGSVN